MVKLNMGNQNVPQRTDGVLKTILADLKVNLYILQFTQETTNYGIQSVANYTWLGLNEMTLLVWISVRLALTVF